MNETNSRREERSENLLLPYEWAQENDWYWRTFRAPAALLNSCWS